MTREQFIRFVAHNRKHKNDKWPTRDKMREWKKRKQKYQKRVFRNWA